jgi:transposase
MRGNDTALQAGMFSYVTLEQRVPKNHPLRAVRGLVDEVLGEMSASFESLYSKVGRPSVPPERLMRALLLQVFYSVRSERMLIEQLDYNLLFRWFVGMEMDEAVWNHAVFSKNRDRLLNHELAQQVFARVKQQAAGLMSDEHFTVDGTLIEAWASHKSFRRKDDNDTDPSAGNDFHGETRANDTHESKTDADARLYKKSYGKESKLSYLGHTLVENRNGLIASAMATSADGHAERDAALLMVDELMRRGKKKRITLGADKAYDVKDFVDTVRELGVVPHVAQNNTNRRSAIDGRTTRHPGYAISLSKRWLVEKPFGWMKQIGGLRKIKLRGLEKVEWLFVFTCAAFNLLRIPKLRENRA